jgi:hypothetical protein
VIPAAPVLTAVSGAGPRTVSWTPGAPAVDHFVVAARPVTENFYRTRVVAGGGATALSVAPRDLGVDGAPAFFLSIAAVDAKGHESLFAYPEYRCDATGCAVPPGALNVTARN